jgi:hypothetical protein
VPLRPAQEVLEREPLLGGVDKPLDQCLRSSPATVRVSCNGRSDPEALPGPMQARLEGRRGCGRLAFDFVYRFCHVRLQRTRVWLSEAFQCD